MRHQNPRELFIGLALALFAIAVAWGTRIIYRSRVTSWEEARTWWNTYSGRRAGIFTIVCLFTAIGPFFDLRNSFLKDSFVLYFLPFFTLTDADWSPILNGTLLVIALWIGGSVIILRWIGSRKRINLRARHT